MQLARLAVDIGGTFTDLALERGGARWTAKVLTTPAAPERGVLEGTRTVLTQAGVSAGRRRAWSSTAPRWPPTRSSNARARAPR